MTGYTVHTGASKKFVAGWDSIFGTGQRKPESASDEAAAKKSSTKKSKSKSKPKKK